MSETTTTTTTTTTSTSTIIPGDSSTVLLSSGMRPCNNAKKEESLLVKAVEESPVPPSRTPRDDEDFDYRLLTAKQWVQDFHQALDKCTPDQVEAVLHQYTYTNTTTPISSQTTYQFWCVYPFREALHTRTQMAQHLWTPWKRAWTGWKRRTDLFFGGHNALHHHDDRNKNDDDNQVNEQDKADTSLWVVSMGHFVGLFDADWMGLRATRQMTMVRFVQFDQVVFDSNRADTSSAPIPRIAHTFLSLDLVGLAESVGLHPLPPSTGTYFCYPGPPNGLAYTNVNAPSSEGKETQALVDQMVADLTSINDWPRDQKCPPELLRRTWAEDMVWYGPAGIGACYTLTRYQEQHQWPFRSQLTNKTFTGHHVRVAEGPYAAFFGWPCNLTNTPTGGLLGLPGCPHVAATTDGSNAMTPTHPLQVVDVYRRQGSKLQENWVFIDWPWYLYSQGVDILERTTRLTNPNSTASWSRLLQQIQQGQEEEEEEDDDDDEAAASLVDASE
eukprot:scaffold1289_cov178-Amphora_coffeaeformis.AAC.7